MSTDPLWGDRPAGARFGLIAIGILLTAALAVIAVTSLLVALHAVLVPRMTPAEALLVVAAVSAMTMIAVAGLTALAAGRARRALRNSLALRAAAVVAPPALSFAMRHVGIAGVLATAAAAYLMMRRR